MVEVPEAPDMQAQAITTQQQLLAAVHGAAQLNG